MAAYQQEAVKLASDTVSHQQVMPLLVSVHMSTKVVKFLVSSFDRTLPRSHLFEEVGWSVGWFMVQRHFLHKLGYIDLYGSEEVSNRAVMFIWRLKERLSELFCAVFCTTIVHNDMHLSAVTWDATIV